MRRCDRESVPWPRDVAGVWLRWHCDPIARRAMTAATLAKLGVVAPELKPSPAVLAHLRERPLGCLRAAEQAGGVRS